MSVKHLKIRVKYKSSSNPSDFQFLLKKVITLLRRAKFAEMLAPYIGLLDKESITHLVSKIVARGINQRRSLNPECTKPYIFKTINLQIYVHL